MARANKRGNTGEIEDDKREATCPVVLQDLLDLKESMLAHVTSCNTSLAGGLSTSVGGLVCKLQAEMQDGFEKQDARIDDLESRLASLEGAAPKVKEEIKALKCGLAVAEAVCPELWIAPDFDRPPIPGLLQVRLAQSVSLEAMEQVVHGLLSECRLQGDAVQVRGKAVDKVFKIQFMGKEGLAGQRAAKFMALQREETGWRTITVPDAENAGCSHKAFFDTDKSRKQIRTEILAKKAANALRKMLPEDRIHVRRQEGKLVLDQVPLLHIVVSSQDEFELKWNLGLLAKRKWDKAFLQHAVESSVRSADAEVEWG